MEYVLSLVRLRMVSLKGFFNVCNSIFGHLHDHFIPHPRNNYHPHILGHRALALFAALLVSVKIFTIALITIGPVIPVYSSAITSLNIVTLTNQARKAFNLSALLENNLLSQAAQAKADDMAKKAYFSHQSPDGSTPWDFIQSTGYYYLSAGENLAINFSEAENVQEAWMNSPGHKANILNKNFEEIGIGIAQGQFQGHSTTFVVQMFGEPVEQKITINKEPTKIQIEDVKKEEPNLAGETADSNFIIQNQALPTEEVQKNENIQNSFEEELSIIQTQVSVEQDRVKIMARVSENATKVLAIFGKGALMLQPKSNGFWENSLELQRLLQEELSIKLMAYDINGKTVGLNVANFTNSTVDNFQILGATEKAKTQWLGRIFNVSAFEQKFYLLFISGILASLILAIAIHRHIQHLSLIANTSFVVILAVLLWLTG